MIFKTRKVAKMLSYRIVSIFDDPLTSRADELTSFPGELNNCTFSTYINLLWAYMRNIKPICYNIFGYLLVTPSKDLFAYSLDSMRLLDVFLFSMCFNRSYPLKMEKNQICRGSGRRLCSSGGFVYIHRTI